MHPEFCICVPESGCDEEGDPGCVYCRALDGEVPCPANPTTYEPDIEGLMDLVKPSGFDAVVVAADGTEPFASMNLGHGLVLDLTATLRRVENAHPGRAE